MKILGALGLDWKMFLIQALNFLILFLILKRLFFKPFIAALKKEKVKTGETQRIKESVEKQKADWQKIKEKEIIEAKKRTQKIIKEAENIAEEIEKNTSRKTSKEAEMLIEQSKNKIKSLRPEIERELFEDIRSEISNSFQASFLLALPLSLQKEFQNVFWLSLIEQLKTITIPKLEDVDLIKILEKFDYDTRRNPGSKNVLEKKLEEIFVKKTGPVILEYVHIPTPEQEKKLEEIILKKTRLKLPLIKKQNKNLINGFRFEITGIIIESNLFSIIQNALRSKE